MMLEFNIDNDCYEYNSEMKCDNNQEEVNIFKFF